MYLAKLVNCYNLKTRITENKVKQNPSPLWGFGGLIREEEDWVRGTFEWKGISFDQCYLDRSPP